VNSLILNAVDVHLTNRYSLFSASGSAGFISRSQLATAVRDAVDASMVSGASSVYQSFKERTVSISSVNEEEDEASLLSERCRYISVSEEDELLALAAGGSTETTITTAATTTAATTAAPRQQQHKQQ